MLCVVTVVTNVCSEQKKLLKKEVFDSTSTNVKPSTMERIQGHCEIPKDPKSISAAKESAAQVPGYPQVSTVFTKSQGVSKDLTCLGKSTIKISMNVCTIFKKMLMFHSQLGKNCRHLHPPPFFKTFAALGQSSGVPTQS
jgi:hypothetical protein